MRIVLIILFLSGIISISTGAEERGRSAIPGNVYGLGLHYERFDICSSTPATLQGNVLLQTKANVISNFTGNMTVKISFLNKTGSFTNINNVKILSGTSVDAIDNEITAALHNSKIQLKFDESERPREVLLQIFTVVKDGEYAGNIRKKTYTNINAC